MKTPNFSQDQYIDAPTLNAASALVSGDFALATGLFKPGLVFPEANSYPATGLAVTANLPSPFAVLFGNGLLAQAYGTITGQDTQAYSVNFSGAVPATGSTTAYLVANYTQIQQGSFQVIGPPVGHPDYNPNFTPYTAYSQNVDSLTVAVTTTPPDNNTIFELFRTTLAAGATGVAPSTLFQQRASGNNVVQSVAVSGNYSVPFIYAGLRQQFTAAGIATLPTASSSNGLRFLFSSATSGATSFQTIGADLIYGGSNPSSGVASYSFSQGTSVDVECDNGIWQIVSGQQPAAATPITGQCQLIYNAGNLVLIPYNGNQIVVAGGTYAVPNAGVTLAPTSLTPGTSYYIYAFLSSGMLALEASATGHTASTTAGNIGTEIKSGDNTRSLVGFWQCVAGPGWSTIATQGLNWFNQKPIAVSVPFTSAPSTSSTSPTFAELSSSFRNTFLTWASQVVNIDFVGVVSMNVGNSGANTSIGIDNATPQDSFGGDFNSAAAASNSASYGKLRLTLTEGLHYATALGAVSSGSTGTWNGGATPGVRCVLSVEVRG